MILPPTASPTPDIQVVSIDRLTERVAELLADSWRLATFTAFPGVRRTGAFGPTGVHPTLTAVLLSPGTGAIRMLECPLGAGDNSFPSMTHDVPQAHWFERAVCDFFGLRPEGHPQLKDLVLHEAWPAGFHPLMQTVKLSDNTTESAGSSAGDARSYEFLEVQGDGVYEIPVGRFMPASSSRVTFGLAAWEK